MTQEAAKKLADAFVSKLVKDEPTLYSACWEQLRDVVKDAFIKVYGDGIVAQKDIARALIIAHPSAHQCAMKDSCAEGIADKIQRS